MHFSTKLILTLLVTIPTIFAKINGECNGRSGICIDSDTCSSYGGQSFSGKCKYDPKREFYKRKKTEEDLAQLMMEEQEAVHLVVNVMVKKLVENVQEVMISNVVLVK